MSRIGKMPVEIPQGVAVEVQGHTVKVKGPKGELTRSFHPDIQIVKEDSQIVVRRPSDDPQHRSLHGLTRALIANMVEGVSQGFKKQLVIEGVGYRAEVRGTKLVLNVGYSHPVEIEPPDGVSISVERGAKKLTIEGTDKELVGQVAAEIRSVRKPEPYQGKGIRYADERVRRKPGKAGKVGVG